MCACLAVQTWTTWRQGRSLHEDWATPTPSRSARLHACRSGYRRIDVRRTNTHVEMKQPRLGPQRIKRAIRNSVRIPGARGTNDLDRSATTHEGRLGTTQDANEGKLCQEPDDRNCPSGTQTWYLRLYTQNRVPESHGTAATIYLCCILSGDFDLPPHARRTFTGFSPGAVFSHLFSTHSLSRVTQTPLTVTCHRLST